MPFLGKFPTQIVDPEVDIDGGAIDGTIIGANDAAAGTFTSLNVSEGDITNVGDINADSISVDTAGTGLNVDFSGANSGTALISLGDDLASALNITESTNSYLKFVTTNNSEAIELGKNTSIAGTAAITGSATNQNVAVIKTTNAASTSGNAFDVQWHNGSAYASALKISAQYGRIGIGTDPDTSTTASAYKVKILGNANVAGSVNATGNLTVTGTGSTGGNFTATTDGKPIKLRMSDGFPTGSTSSTHPITDYISENFYSSMSTTDTISAGGSIVPGTIESIGYINMAGNNDVFQVVEVFATITIKNSNSNEITKRLTEKIYGIYDNGIVETVREWSQGDTSLGQFHCVLESDGDGSGNAAMEVLFRYTNHTNNDVSNAEDMKIAVNINGLSMNGAPPS